MKQNKKKCVGKAESAIISLTSVLLSSCINHISKKNKDLICNIHLIVLKVPFSFKTAMVEVQLCAQIIGSLTTEDRQDLVCLVADSFNSRV